MLQDYRMKSYELFAELASENRLGILHALIEAIAQNAGFFHNHDTSVIPPHLLKKLEALSKGEIIEGVFILVNRMQILFEEIVEYAWYLSDNFPLFYLLAIVL